MADKGYLVLEDGSIFEGEWFGAPLTGDQLGEVVFTTSMAGYTESLTDPSYVGQILTMTFPEIGNHGICLDDMESRGIHMKGLVVKNHCEASSHFRLDMQFEDFLKKHNVPALCGVDTRALAKLIREKGTMNGVLTKSPEQVDKTQISRYTIDDPVAQVGATERSVRHAEGCDLRVALWDFGATESMVRQLNARGMDAILMPHDATAQQILDEQPDGVLISSGPGDPVQNEEAIRQIALLVQSGVPIFGICLGHQMLALSQGGGTMKLKYGHRGANHPVRDMSTGRIYITNQNHGYAVRMDQLPKSARVSHANLNDDSCEGLTYDSFPGFSVQFHPEAKPGPRDTLFLFDRFRSMLKSC